MATNGNQKWQNVAPKFCCEICDYHTSKKYNMDKHLFTAKHLNCYKLNSLATNSNTFVAKVATPLCNEVELNVTAPVTPNPPPVIFTL